MKKNLFVLIPGLLLTMVLTSCGCGGKTPTGGTIVPTSTPTPTSSQPATPTPSKVAVTAVVLDKSSAELEIGEKLILVATVAPKNATNKKVTWSSNNVNVATVENGVVTAKSNGQAVITVKTEDGGKTATCTVTVKKAAQPTPTPTPSQPVTPTPSQPTVPVTPTPTVTPEPTSYAHYVMVGETKMWLVEQPADPGNPDMLRQFTTLQNFDVTAGTQFSFFNEGGAWEVHAETEYGTGKLTGNLNEELIVRESAEGVALWLHEYEGGYVDAWLGGYEGGVTPTPTGETGWYLKGTMNEWAASEQYALSLKDEDLPEGTAHQYYISLALEAAAEFKFNLGETWLGYDDLENDGAIANFSRNNEETESNNNIIVDVAGSYDFYLKELSAGGYQIYVGSHGGEPTPIPTPTTVETVWHLKGTMNEWAAAEEYALEAKDEDLPEGTAHQYFINVELEAAAEFKFALNNIWLGYDDLENTGAFTNFSRNNKEGDGNNNIIVDVAGSYDFYLKELSAGGYSIYVGTHGGEPTPVPTPTAETVWHMKGTMTDPEWAAVEAYALVAKDEDLPEGTAHQFYISVTLEAAAEFKFNLGETWLGYDSLENAGAIASFSKNTTEGESYGNIIVDTAGTYDFYLKELSAGGYSIYVGTHGGEPTPTPTPTTPTEHVYKVLVGETEYTLEERDPDPDNESMIKQYTLSENIDVVAGTQFSFLMDGVAWTVHAEVQYGTETLTGNLNADLQVRESAEGVALWLHEYEGGYVDAWLGGYTGGGEPTPTPTVQQCKYSLLVGETAYDTTRNNSPLDPSYDEYMALNIAVTAGDEIQVRDNESAGTPIWTIQILNPSSVGFEMSGEKMVCTTSGTYDFYLKFKYGADEVYIGLHS